MTLFKRISASFMSRIDHVVGELENHEAVVQASLADMRRKVAEARVRLAHIRTEGQRLRKDAEEYRQTAERWRQRALQTAGSDEAKALECLRRARESDRQAERARERVAHYEQTAERLGRDLATSEQRLEAIRHKAALMRARQSAGAALSATDDIGSAAVRHLEDTFERWEVRIGELEMSVGGDPSGDALDREFFSREEDAALRSELNALVNREGNR